MCIRDRYRYCFFHVRNVLESDVETDRIGACHRLRIDAAVGFRIEISVVVRGEDERVAGFEMDAQTGQVEFTGDSFRESV